MQPSQALATSDHPEAAVLVQRTLGSFSGKIPVWTV
jgi:hypothetical protein